MNEPKIALFDSEGSCVFRGSIYQLPLTEAAIIGACEDHYGTVEVCLRRRESAKRALYFQLEEQLLQLDFHQSNQLPSSLRGTLNLPPIPLYVELLPGASKA